MSLFSTYMEDHLVRTDAVSKEIAVYQDNTKLSKLQVKEKRIHP